MSFDLNAAHEAPVTTGQNFQQYVKPGISDNVKVSEVVLLQTQKNSVDYMELKLVNDKGELGRSNKMFLGTEIKPGNKTSGWGVTARNIRDIIMATYDGISKQDAEAMIAGVPTKEELVAKIASILVGKPFRGKFIGQEGQNGKIYATLDRVESTKVVPTKLKFSELNDIHKYVPYVADAVAGNVDEKKNDLPF